MSNINNTILTKNKGKKDSSLGKVLLLGFLLFFPLLSFAQFDHASVEALINDHKKQRSLLIARQALEISNEQLHKLSKVTNKQYKDINDNLDKYTKAFDYIDLVYNTLCTGFNVVNTVNTVSDKITKYRDLLQDYNDRLLSKGNIETADTIILTTSYNTIKAVADECENLYSVFLTLGLYASNKVQCKVSDMNVMVGIINQSLDRIKELISRCYFKTWQYLQSRMYYWKPVLYNSKSLKDLGKEAFDRWKEASKNALDGTVIGSKIGY